MRAEVLYVRKIDEATERILQYLKEGDAAGIARSGSRNNVIYFDGWDGLGASAVLQEVRRRLTIGAGCGFEFTRVLHVDCSKWESRRGLQRALARQLGLPAPVMELFDVQDEEDDYRSIAEGSRAEIPEVSEAISQHVQTQVSRFVVIFHNGSDEDVDLNDLGFPLPAFSRHRVLWTFQGRLRLCPRVKVVAALTKTTPTTDLILSGLTPTNVYSDDAREAYDYAREMMIREAEELVRDIDPGGLVDLPAAVAANCHMYMTMLRRTGNDLTDYDLATHGFNYCICDGVIQLQQQGDVQFNNDNNDDGAVDRLWRWSHALQREMRLHADQPRIRDSSYPVSIKIDRKPFWASPTYGFIMIPESQSGRILRGMFLLFDGLCVLKLYGCVFSFKSPPFLCCHSLRFLWIDSCQDAKDEEQQVDAEEDLRQCLERLWVLHVRDSSAFLSDKTMGFITQVRELIVMGQETLLRLRHGQLPHIQKFRVADSPYVTVEGLALGGMDKLELLEFSGELYMERLHAVRGCRNLATVSIQGADIGSVDLKGISLKGCENLKNLFLTGSFPDLCRLDVSGTAVKTLDLSKVEAPKLGKLFLFDCEDLRAILWPSQGSSWRRNFLNLGIDTTQRDHQDDVGPSTPRRTEFGWYIASRDARLLGSLEPIKDLLDHNNLHLDISSRSSPSNSSRNLDADGRIIVRSISGQQELQAANNQWLQRSSNYATTYADIVASLKDSNSMQQQQANEADDEHPYIMCLCPLPPYFPTSQCCYIHIEDQMNAKSSLQSSASITVSGFICDHSKILHIHDSPFTTGIISSSSDPTEWKQLEWFQVERCPKMEFVFHNTQADNGSVFNKLRTLWASHLPHARYIWEWRAQWSREQEEWSNENEILSRMRLKILHDRGGLGSLMNLTFMHLDRCPRLIYAVSVPVIMYSVSSLETLEITFCNDLGVVFYPHTEFADILKRSIWELPRLKHIHLHELPKLRGICGMEGEQVRAPKLETVKIRGCWSLKRLPYIGGKNTVECDCEKEWWDALNWDSKDHAESYKPTHPRHYKKKTLRSSVLR